MTIENGTIANFFFGIYLNGASDNTIRGITADGNVSAGMYIENGSNNNQISANFLSGLSLLDSDGNGITGNRVDANGSHSLPVRSGSDQNAVRGNEFDSHGLRGILVSAGGGFSAPADNRFEGNEASGNELFDVVDMTTGDGTEGTDSTYRGMRCETSSPQGICVP